MTLSEKRRARACRQIQSVKSFLSDAYGTEREQYGYYFYGSFPPTYLRLHPLHMRSLRFFMHHDWFQTSHAASRSLSRPVVPSTAHESRTNNISIMDPVNVYQTWQPIYSLSISDADKTPGVHKER